MILGDIVLKIFNFFSIENIKKVFTFSYEDEKEDFFRTIITNKKVIGGLIILLGVIFFLIPLEIFIIIIVILLMLIFTVFYLPNIKERQKYNDITIELPYALRHMATELKSGKGLHDALYAIAISDYGSLSLEFKRVLEEVKHGETTELH